jgi:predicted ferric reductase
MFKVTGRWFEGFPTTLEHMPGNVIKLRVLAPASFKWKPGQHVFLRFTSLSPFDNHPFTISSIYGAGARSSGKEDGPIEVQPNELNFLVRTYGGFTKKLHKHAISNTDISVSTFVDGPYGGISRVIENAYDSVVIIAGGGGVTASIPWLLHLANKMNSGQARTRQVHFIWIVRTESHLQWFDSELQNAFQTAPAGSVKFHFYVTDKIGDLKTEPHSGSISETSTSDIEVEQIHESGKVEEKRTENVSKGLVDGLRHLGTVHEGRPDLRKLIPQLATNFLPRTAILGESFNPTASSHANRDRMWTGILQS